MRVWRTESDPEKQRRDTRKHDAARDSEEEIRDDQQDLGARVGAHREESGLSEREQPRVTEQQIEAEREHRKDQDLHREIDRVTPGHPAAAARERRRAAPADADGGEAAAHRSALHRANRPCGRTSSTTAMMTKMKNSSNTGKKSVP